MILILDTRAILIKGQAYFSDDLYSFVLAIKQYVNLNLVPAFIVIYI